MSLALAGESCVEVPTIISIESVTILNYFWGMRFSTFASIILAKYAGVPDSEF